MHKRFIFYSTLIFILVITISFVFFQTGLLHKAKPISLESPLSPWFSIILMPLDSRPPCTQFVEQLAAIANIKIIIPPPELMDNYKMPANQQSLRQWLLINSKHADMAIISTDMLIHGGLVASRLSHGTSTDITQTLALLTAIHSQNPQLKIYAFNIIPRLLIADNEENIKFQKDMLKYSVIKDQIILFENTPDIENLAYMEQKLPAKLTNNYLEMYEQNNALNFSLARLVEQGVLTSLVIGQDDSQPLGLPNINKQKIQQYINHKPELTNRIFITRGTDELALSILGRIVTDTTNYHPRVWVAYSHPEAPNIIMPFMPVSVSQSVKEKIVLAGGTPADSPQTADFILYVHIGTKKMQGNQLVRASQEVNQLLQDGYKVALIDLAEDFYASETLLPVLLSQDTDITKLISYAGWNTTSNSLGTAITQAIAFLKLQHTYKEPEEMIYGFKKNLAFTINRCLDDYYYQKLIQPQLNKSLKTMQVDPYNLKSYRQQADSFVQFQMQENSYQFFTQALLNKPLLIETNRGSQTYTITNLTTKNYFPWDRTFEIRLEADISLAKIENDRRTTPVIR